MKAKRRNRDSFHGRIQVRVGCDDDRVLAAHLGDDALDPLLSRLRLGGQLVDAQANFFGAGKRDEPNRRVRDDDVADFAARTRNEIHNTGRYADFLQKIDEPRRNDRGVARGFKHDRIPGNNRGGRHADHNRGCEVPRWNHRSDAEGNVDQFVPFALERHDRLGLRVAEGFARVKLEKVNRLGNIAVGLDPTLADFVD